MDLGAKRSFLGLPHISRTGYQKNCQGRNLNGLRQKQTKQNKSTTEILLSLVKGTGKE